MPRFFFDTDDGTTQLRDEDGLEFPDGDRARDEATRAMGEMAKDQLPIGDPQKDISIWVRDESGEPVLQLALSFAVKSLKAL